MSVLTLPPTDDRTSLYLRYKTERGMTDRYGGMWMIECPERVLRLERELALIESQGFAPYFLILAKILDFCRAENIAYGPGRGSVGGCYAAYALGIHEVDSIEWGLLFERFLTPDRVTWPDVDLDFSQRDRPRVLAFIREEFEDDEYAVLQVAAFARAGGRSVVRMMLAAHQDDPNAGAIAENLQKALPEGNIAGGQKVPRELAFWLESGKAGNQERFTELSKQAGWLDTMLKLDGIQTHLAKHAAGVVVLARNDMARLPQCGAKDTESGRWNMMTGYDMYALEDLSYLKIDVLGLRTLDLISDAHKLAGLGSGSTRELMDLWRQHQEDSATYELLRDADTLGVFQMETAGYRHTLKSFQPTQFEHIVHLNALYRPGALDAIREEDGKNMVEVYIERLHGREGIFYSHGELAEALGPILGVTQGIVLFQEQAMEIARKLAGFTGAEADALRKAIGKKKRKEMEALHAKFTDGMETNGYSKNAAVATWNNIAAAARYSWNKSHSVEYGVLTFLCAFFKANHPAAFFTAYINSWSDKMERQSEGIAEARQRVQIKPPDINVAQGDYTVDDGAIVFGLNGIKGMGEANRHAILLERALTGPFRSFEEFHERCESVPINMKLSLIACGAFDALEDRTRLLAQVPYDSSESDGQGGRIKVIKWRTVAEHIKHNSKLKKKRPLPPPMEWRFPTTRELTKGELETIGFYVSTDPMTAASKALARIDKSIHWAGMIESVRRKNDRNGNLMAHATLLTNALNKLKLTIFASVYDRCAGYLDDKERQIIVRGTMDGSQVKVDAIFEAGDYRHFRMIKVKRGEEPERRERFDGKVETIELFENSGYSVQLF